MDEIHAWDESHFSNHLCDSDNHYPGKIGDTSLVEIAELLKTLFSYA